MWRVVNLNVTVVLNCFSFATPSNPTSKAGGHCLWQLDVNMASPWTSSSPCNLFTVIGNYLLYEPSIWLFIGYVSKDMITAVSTANYSFLCLLFLYLRLHAMVGEAVSTASEMWAKIASWEAVEEEVELKVAQHTARALDFEFRQGAAQPEISSVYQGWNNNNILREHFETLRRGYHSFWGLRAQYVRAIIYCRISKSSWLGVQLEGESSK